MWFMRRKPYPTDLSDAEWANLKPLLPSYARGAPRRVKMREVINALRYLARTGCQWRLLPHDLPLQGRTGKRCWQ
jgi:transposase